jgi:integrase
MSDQLPSAALVIREHNGRVFYEAKFRHDGLQVMRRIGPAWLVRTGDEWDPRKGRIADGYYDERRAHVKAAELVKAYVKDAAESDRVERERKARGMTFRELSAGYLIWVEAERGAKPSTLRDHRRLLAEPGTERKRGSGELNATIMVAIGHKPASKVTREDVTGLLAAVASRGAAPRTVNKHRNLVAAIFAYGVRERGLAHNPVVGIGRRREPEPERLDFYRPEDVEAVARALENGLHREVNERHARGCAMRRGGLCSCTPTYRARGEAFETLADARAHHRQHRTDDELADDRQAAAAVRVASYAGLRLGELLALRWRDVNFAGSVLHVDRALSAGKETTTKSGRGRNVPLTDQAVAALDGLSRRENFTSADDLVFCNSLGRTLDGAALRRPFERARDATGLRPLRWHDLRHTFGSLLVAGGVDLVSVKDAMGHARITTTERYLHARPATESAAVFTRAFAVTGAADVSEAVSVA